MALEEKVQMIFHTDIDLDSMDAVQKKCPRLILWRQILLVLLNFPRSTRNLLTLF